MMEGVEKAKENKYIFKSRFRVRQRGLRKLSKKHAEYLHIYL